MAYRLYYKHCVNMLSDYVFDFIEYNVNVTSNLINNFATITILLYYKSKNILLRNILVGLFTEIFRLTPKNNN